MLRKLSGPVMVAVCLLTATPATASAQDTCGGAWQVPCYYWDWCAWRGAFGECWGGLVAVPPYNGCDHSGLNNWGLLCVPCGSNGEPLCNFPPACNPRHIPLGLCFECSGPGEPACWEPPECIEGYRNVFGFCSYSGYSPEPTTNVTGLPDQQQPMRPDGSVRGIADVHTHMFANLGFGGVMFWGAPFDWNGINTALAWCDYTWQFATRSVLGPRDPFATFGYAVHGPKEFQGIENPVDWGVSEGFHSVDGTGGFTGWPKYNSYTHQQMYHTWVKRAYEGGVRLIVMLAINSEALCYSQKQRVGWDCDDMKAVDRQLQAAKDLEQAIDWLDDYRYNQSGWYRIAYSPHQARDLIRAGKMAVVLGIEVDSLFNCKYWTECTDTYLHQQLHEYYNLGVRHIFPIHHYDNAFGGSAIFFNLLNIGSVVITGHQPIVRDCSSQGYNYNVGPDPFNVLWQVFNFLFGTQLPDLDYYNQFAADCNLLDLSSTGRAFIDRLMEHKFIIDTDHMSRSMIDEVLLMAKNRSPMYPLVSSHTWFRDLNPDTYLEPLWISDEVKEGFRQKREFSLTDKQMDDFREIGGLVTAITPKARCGSSSAYRGMLQYAVDKMKKSEDDAFPAIAFSTDIQGFAEATGPRFGPEACETPEADTELVYPFQGPFGGSFGKQVTGARTFDFNTQGMAHYGLIPDFFADLKAQHVPDELLEVLLNSAEAYIRVWAAIDSRDQPLPPTVTARMTGTLGLNGWYTSDVTVEWDVTPASEADTIVSSTGCDPTTVTADTTGFTLQCMAVTNRDASSSAQVTVRRDATPPVVGVPTSTVAPGTWTNGDIRVTFSATDATSGVVGATEVEVTLISEGAGQMATTTFTDQAGNVAVASLAGLNIDRTPPLVGFRFASLPPDASPEAQLAEQARWHNESVVLTVSADDPLSGVASIAPTELELSAEGAAVRGSAVATDRAGNSTTAESFAVKIDLTAPTIALVSRTPGPDANGWNTSAVTVRWTCGDVLSGVTAGEVASTVDTEGAAQSAEGTCTDLAGNTASATEGGINIDWTPPTVACSAAPASLWPPNNRMVPATVDLTLTDAMSGPRDYVLTAASSNEAGAASDISGFVVGAASLSGALRAEREGSGTGRVYTFEYRAFDLAGNTAACTTFVLVPHDQGKDGKRRPE